MITRYVKRYCKGCGREHRAMEIWGDYAPLPRVRFTDGDQCSCGVSLDRDNTSYHRSEEEYQQMRSEIKIVLVTDDEEEVNM